MDGLRTKAESEDFSDLRRIGAEDREGLLDLFDRRSPRILGLLIHLGVDHATAEKLLQEVFLHVWWHPEAYPHGPRMTPYVWLLTLARDRARHQLGESRSRTADAPTPPVLAEQAFQVH